MDSGIVIIDYGMGNLRNVQKGFEKVGHAAKIVRGKREIGNASGLVLPGVGAFMDCMQNLEKFGLVEPILRSIEKGKPFLGICLGLQVLFSESEEFGYHQGLNVIPGKVVRFQPDAEHKVPHMGWNTIEVKREPPIFREIRPGDFFYFVHSYYVVPENRDHVSTITDYGIPFTSSVWKDNVFAVQFHPEKSQQKGLTILKNFAKWM